MPAPLSCAHNAAPRHRTTGLAGKRDNGPMGGIKGRPGRGGGHCLDGGGRGRGPRGRTEAAHCGLRREEARLELRRTMLTAARGLPALGWKGQRQLTEKRRKGQSWGSLENRKGGGGSISWTGGKIFWKRRRRADNEFAASLQAADCGGWGEGGTRASHASPALIILMPSRPLAL